MYQYQFQEGGVIKDTAAARVYKTLYIQNISIRRPFLIGIKTDMKKNVPKIGERQ